MRNFQLFIAIKDELSKRGIYDNDPFIRTVTDETTKLNEAGLLDQDVLQQKLSSKDKGFFQKYPIKRKQFYQLVTILASQKEDYNEIESFGIFGHSPFDDQQKIVTFFRLLKNEILWKDKQFSEEGLIVIHKYCNHKQLRKIRVLTGWEKLNEGFKKRYLALKKQLSAKGVNLEMRALTPEAMKHKHDRYIFFDRRVFNVSPSSQLFNPKEGDFQETENIGHRKVTEKEWSSQSLDLVKHWHKIQKFRKKLQ